jgi:hypothetical protein
LLAIALAVALVGADVPPPAPTVSVPLAADFTLKTTDKQGTDTVSGSLQFLPGGEICVAVKSPRIQEMRLAPTEMVIYYPDQDLAFVAHLAPPQPPPMLDALAAGLVDPSSTLPKSSKLIERKHANGELITRWRVVDDAGKNLGEMRAVETRAGARSVDLIDAAGKPQRHFTFEDRVRVGTRTVPRAIVADYFMQGGVQQREEQWALDHVSRYDPQKGNAIGCAKLRPQTKIQTLTW